MDGKRKLIDSIVDFVLYGDIDEVPWSVLGDKCPDLNKVYDREQIIRLNIAATLENIKKDL